MKKTSILFCALTLGLSVQAQRADTVNTGNNSYGVYYNLNNGTETNVLHTDWDIAFTTASFDASILINEANGAKLYVYSDDTSQWNSVDTAGFDFSSFYTNSTESWSLGAFSAMGTGHPDYGWGRYESSNHHLYGSKIFLLDNGRGHMCQLIIDELTVGGQWIFRTADIGGANAETNSYSKSSYSEDNFFFFNTANGEVNDGEPKSDEWHLLFTKYYADVQGQSYPVSGIKVNAGLEIAERSGVSVESNDTAGVFWTSSISEIGYDWKTFNMQTFSYDLTPDLVFFVRNDLGDLWKIYFTAYSGGTYEFNVEKVAHSLSVPEFKAFEVQIYPNPAQDAITIQNAEGEQASLRLYGMNGQLLQQTELGALQQTTLDVSGLQAGLYLIEIQGMYKQSTYRIAVQ